LNEFMLRVAQVVIALGAVLVVVVFLTGLGRGLSAGTPASRKVIPGDRAVRARSPNTTRALLLLMLICVFGGVFLARPMLLVIAVVCLLAAYWTSRR
jgi:hypothetical protein